MHGNTPSTEDAELWGLEGPVGLDIWPIGSRLITETEQMIKDADELHALSPNVMIKAPASMQGVEAVKIAEKKGVDLGRWRAVITMMVGRLTERKALMEQAARRDIELSWQDKHWFGIAVFRRAHRLLTEGDYVSKMFACSLRHGPVVAGKTRFWDVQKIAGDIVFTCPPYVLEPLFAFGDDLVFRYEIEDEVPPDVMDKLMKIPYCIQAYEPNGLALEQFNDHPATKYTVEAFSKACVGLEEYVGERIALKKSGRKVVAE